MLGSRRSVAYDLADLLLGDANPLLSARRYTRRASKSTAYDMDMDSRRWWSSIPAGNIGLGRYLPP